MDEKTKRDYLIYPGAPVAILEASDIRCVTDKFRATRGEDTTVVGGYSIRFDPMDGSGGNDLYGQWFTSKTYLGPRDGGSVEAYFHHGYEIQSDDIARNVTKALAESTFGEVMVTRDDIGIWAEVVLNMHDDYEERIAQMVADGVLSYSSGSSGHLVRIEDLEDIKDEISDDRYEELDERFWWPGRIRRWPVAEHSLTPTPAEHRNKVEVVRAVRSLTGGPFLKTEQKPAQPGIPPVQQNESDQPKGSDTKTESKIIVMDFGKAHHNTQTLLNRFAG